MYEPACAFEGLGAELTKEFYGSQLEGHVVVLLGQVDYLLDFGFRGPTRTGHTGSQGHKVVVSTYGLSSYVEGLTLWLGPLC